MDEQFKQALENSYNLSAYYISQNQLLTAEAVLGQFLNLYPDNIEPYILLADLYLICNSPSAAELILEKAIASGLQDVKIYLKLSSIYHDNIVFRHSEEEGLKKVIQASLKALELEPDFPGAYNNLANGYDEYGDFDKAIKYYQKAIKLAPNESAFHVNYALTLLKLGRYKEGWKEYEYRWQGDAYKSRLRTFHQPKWNGKNLKNKTLLIHREQGLGDAIQFMRYIPLVKEKFSKIKLLIEIDNSLVTLAQSSFNSICENIQPHIDPAGSNLNHFDTYIGLLSLPDLFQTTVNTIPNKMPYLKASNDRIAYWKNKIHKNKKIKIGICWAGGIETFNARLRKISLNYFKTLFNLPNTDWYSLQVGLSSKEIEQENLNKLITDYSSELTDFQETAALMENLDLIISTETAVLHLAGALGKKTYVLLPYISEWRWLENRKDSPWYPTMSLFQQKERQNWEEVIERVYKELLKFVGAK